MVRSVWKWFLELHATVVLNVLKNTVLLLMIGLTFENNDISIFFFYKKVTWLELICIRFIILVLKISAWIYTYMYYVLLK